MCCTCVNCFFLRTTVALSMPLLFKSWFCTFLKACALSDETMWPACAFATMGPLISSCASGGGGAPFFTPLLDKASKACVPGSRWYTTKNLPQCLFVFWFAREITVFVPSNSKVPSGKAMSRPV